jgi:hypothetical protein
VICDGDSVAVTAFALKDGSVVWQYKHHAPIVGTALYDVGPGAGGSCHLSPGVPGGYKSLCLAQQTKVRPPST